MTCVAVGLLLGSSSPVAQGDPRRIFLHAQTGGGWLLLGGSGHGDRYCGWEHLLMQYLAYGSYLALRSYVGVVAADLAGEVC